MKALRNVLFFLCVAFIAFFTGCNYRYRSSIDVLQIEGVSWVCNVTASFATFGSSSENEEFHTMRIPVMAGDLLYMIKDDLEYYYRYLPENGSQLSVSFDTLNAVSVYLNGNLDYMELSASSSLEAFKLLTDPEIQSLSILNINGPITDDLIKILKQHQTVLSGKGLVLEGVDKSIVISELLSIFRPGLLVMDASWDGIPDQKAVDLFSNLDLLWIDGKIPMFANMASCCSNLESLIIANWEPEQGEMLPLSGLKKLYSLSIAESAMTSLSGIEFPGSLRHLHLISCDTLSDITRLGDLHKLQRLNLTLCDKVKNVNPLQELSALQWLSLPANISQKEFSLLADHLPKLQLIELIACTEIENLAPLIKMPELRSLILQLEQKQLSMIDSLNQLQLIVLTNEVFEDDPLFISNLRSSLPQTEIVPGSGLCLGSGWLILLLPFILLFRHLFRPKALSCA